MRLQKQPANFTGIKIAIAVAIAILVGYLGYTFYANYKASNKETVSKDAKDVRPAPAISTPNDLDKAAETVEQSEIESSNSEDMSDIEKDLSQF